MTVYHWPPSLGNRAGHLYIIGIIGERADREFCKACRYTGHARKEKAGECGIPSLAQVSYEGICKHLYGAISR